MTVSIYLREHTGNLSSIKFGSYDPSAIHPQASLYVFRTISQREWSLNVKDFQVNDGNVLGANKELYFSYHLPYLYLPDTEFNEYVEQIKKWDSHIVCRTDICWYADHDCHDISSSKYFMIKFKIFDSTARQFSLGIPVSHGFYISNKDLGHNETVCALPIIRSRSDNQNRWYFGSSFLSYFYTVLDQTPLTEHNKDYIQIGIAPRNSVPP